MLCLLCLGAASPPLPPMPVNVPITNAPPQKPVRLLRHVDLPAKAPRTAAAKKALRESAASDAMVQRVAVTSHGLSSLAIAPRPTYVISWNQVDPVYLTNAVEKCNALGQWQEVWRGTGTNLVDADTNQMTLWRVRVPWALGL